jgi:hypothetical protein
MSVASSSTTKWKDSQLVIKTDTDAAITHPDVHYPPKEKIYTKNKTKTGKSLMNVDMSDMYSTHPSPPWEILRRYPSCRLIDPADKSYTFWCASYIPFNIIKVNQLVRTYCIDEGDMLLWVYQRLKDKDIKQPISLPPTSNTVPRSFIVVSPEGGGEPVEIKTEAYVIKTSAGESNYNTSRRSGYIVLRNLHSV